MLPKISRHRAKTSVGLILTVTGILVYLAGYPTPLEQIVKAQAPPCPNCSPDIDRVIYAPTIGLPEAEPGNIVLNCRSMHLMDVVPTFYTETGESIVGDVIHLQPAEIRFVTVDSLIPEAHRGQHTWGGMSLSYFGKLMEVWAQITLPGAGERGSSDIVFSVLNGSGSDTQEAVWWQPRPGRRIVALGNSSDSAIHTTARFSDGSTEEIDIAPYATHYIRDNIGGNSPDGADSVKLTTVGPAGSLKANGYVMSTSNSQNHRFASSIRFYDTLGVVQSKLFATNFRAKNSSSHLLLRNTSTASLTAAPTFRPSEGNGAPVILPSVVIDPSQSLELDLQPLLDAAAVRPELESVSIEIGNTGAPGTLIGALYAKNLSTGVRYDVPMRDSGRLRNSTGAYPWRLDGDYQTTVTITNVGVQTVGFCVMIFYDGGQYKLTPPSLDPGQTAKFDLRQIRDQQIPDHFGHVLPLNAVSGQFDWGIIHYSEQTRLAGRSEVVSASENVSSSYSCNYCCPPQGPSFVVPSVSLMQGETVTSPVQEWWYNCFGWGFLGEGMVPGPYTVEQSITASADMPESGSLRVQGLTAGDAWWTSSEYEYNWSYEGPYDCVSGHDLLTTGGSINVSPTVTNVTSDTNTYKITSILGNQNYIHFVTPKGTGPIILTATISPDTPEIRNKIDWEGATEQLKNPLVATVSRGTASRNVVKIKYDGHTLKEMRVWVVWSTITSVPVPNTTPTPVTTGTPAGPAFALLGGYDFTHTIEPASIITDSDRPDFSGPNLHPPPGGNHPIFGDPLSGGANKKWDASQQLRLKILNPNSILVADTGFHPYGFPADVLNYPMNDAEGNDDRSTNDETNDPYTNSAVLTGHDNVMFAICYRAGVDGNTFEYRIHLRTFTRLEIEGNWFRISDFYLWRFPHSFIKQNGVWVDNGSIKDLTNSGF